MIIIWLVSTLEKYVRAPVWKLIRQDILTKDMTRMQYSLRSFLCSCESWQLFHVSVEIPPLMQSNRGCCRMTLIPGLILKHVTNPWWLLSVSCVLGRFCSVVGGKTIWANHTSFIWLWKVHQLPGYLVDVLPQMPPCLRTILSERLRCPSL